MVQKKIEIGSSCSPIYSVFVETLKPFLLLFKQVLNFRMA